MGKKATGYKIDVKDAPKKLSLEHLSFGSFFPAPNKGYKHYTKKFTDDVKLWIVNELKLHPDRTKDIMYRIISLGNSEEGTKYDRDFVDIVRGVWDSFTNKPMDKDRYTGSWLWKENGMLSNPDRDWNSLFSFGNVKGLYQPIAKDSIRGINNNTKYPTYYGNFVPKKSYTITEEYSPILLYLADKNLGGLALDEETNEGIVLLPFSDEEYNLAVKEGYTVDNVGRFNVNIGRDTKGNPEVLFYDLGDFGSLYADTYGEDKDKVAFQGLLLNTFGNPFILRLYVPINTISLEQFESMPDNLKWQVDDMNGALLDIAKANGVTLYNPITRLYESGLPEVTVTPKKHDDGGNLNEPLDWNKLPMKVKAAYIKIGVANGYKDIDSIIKVYNEYKNNSHSYKDGGNKSTYTPSDNIKNQISNWEGAAMHGKTIDPLSGKLVNKNRSFELETEAFIKALPSSIRDKVLSNLELADHLFSYSYNVGAGNFRRRVVPELLNYYNGTGNIDNITDSMWASGDTKLKGLRTRRAIEKEGVRNALSNLLYPIVELTDVLRVDNPYNNTMLDTGVYTEPQKIQERVITPKSSRQYILYNTLDILDLIGALIPTYTPIKIALTTATDLLKLLYLNTLLDKDLEDTIYNKVFGDKYSKGGNIFEGTTTSTLLMNNPMSNPNVFRRPDGTYFYHNYDTDEDTDIFPLNTMFDDPAYWTFKDKSGKIYNPRLTPSIDLGTIVPDESNKITKPISNYFDELSWRINNDPSSIFLKGKYTIPAVLGTSLLPVAGEAAAPILANPYVDAGLTSAFAAHGLNHAINEGIDGWGDAAMTSLEVAPLGRLARPMYNAGKEAVYNIADRYMFMPHQNSFTRGIGITDAGLQDAIKTGVFRGNPRGTEYTAKQFTKGYKHNRDHFKDIMDETGIEDIASKFQSRTLSEEEFNAIKEASKKYTTSRMELIDTPSGKLDFKTIEISADPLESYPNYISYKNDIAKTIAEVEKMPARIASGEVKVNTELTPTVTGIPHGQPIEERFGPNSDYVSDGQPLSYWYPDGRNPITRGHAYAKSNYGVRVNNPEDYTPFMHELHLHPSFFKTPQLADPNVEIFGKGPLGLTVKLDKETLQPLWKKDLSNIFKGALYNDMYIPYKISNAINKGVKENAVITAYNRNPATKDIGNLWDYQYYLDNVFPNSKVKDVLWHGSTSKNLQSFSPEHIGSHAPIKKSVGMYLAPERATSTNYGKKGDVYPVLLNTENPFITDQIFGGISKNGVNVAKISPEVRSTLLANNDAVIAPKRGEIAFFNPDDALILGSDADVAGFREFMGNTPKGLKLREPLIARDTPQITAENAASITPEQWIKDIDYSALKDASGTSKFTLYLYNLILSNNANKLNNDALFPIKIGGIVDKPISQEMIDIYNNTVLPRLLAMRPGYRGGILRPTVKANVEEALNRGYTVYPEEVFNKAGKENTLGILFTNDGHIAVREGYENLALGHEVRHRLSELLLPEVEEETTLLRGAFDDGFDELPKLYEKLKNVRNMDAERVTTNFDARSNVLGDYHLKNTDWKLQNKIIDKTSDEKIFNAVETSNGYGQAYIDYLRKNNKLTPEKAQQFREAMKHVGSYIIPATIGGTALYNMAL